MPDDTAPDSACRESQEWLQSTVHINSLEITDNDATEQNTHTHTHTHLSLIHI